MRWIVLKKKEGYFQQSNGQLALFQPDFIPFLGTGLASYATHASGEIGYSDIWNW